MDLNIFAFLKRNHTKNFTCISQTKEQEGAAGMRLKILRILKAIMICLMEK